MKTLIPQNDRVLLRPIDEGEQMYGNIVIPDMGKERPEMGEVIAVGDGRLSEHGTYIVPRVEVGDVVLVPKIGTMRIEFEGTEYYLVPDREILCKVVEQYNPQLDHEV